MPSAGEESLLIRWGFPPGEVAEEVEIAYITATYIGPCPDVTAVPEQQVVLNAPSDDIYTVEELLPYSMYRINVTLFTENTVATGFFVGARTNGKGKKITYCHS